MWIDDLFGVKKPIVALLHLRELPGDPRFGDGCTMEKVIEAAKAELCALQKGGVDGILFANEFSLPYEKRVSYVTVAAMARIIGELRQDIQVPYGVNIVLNPIATIDLAVAVDASFVRGTFTGTYIGENGLVDTDIPATLRHRRALGANHLRMLYKVNPESDVYLADRKIEQVAKSMIFHCFPDGLCVSGSSAGSETDSDLIKRVKAVSGDTPVFCNTGCTKSNIADKLRESDGACVGTAFKKDGKFSAFVDEARVQAFMDEVKAFRKTI